MMSFSHHFLLLFLFATGFLAGTVDAIAGGGGLISLPVLFGVGISPHVALGTNKLQSSLGTLVATWRYHKQGWVSLRSVIKAICFVALGATVGAICGQVISGDVLKKVVPVVSAIIFVYTIFSPKFGSVDKTPKLSADWFFPVFGFLLGFYDGFIGPGTGSFWMFALTFFLGFNLIKATAYTKIFNLTSNLVALACFAFGGNIDYRLGFVMALGQVMGGYLGAQLAIKKGARMIRPFFLVVVFITIATLVYKNHFSKEEHAVHALVAMTRT